MVFFNEVKDEKNHTVKYGYDALGRRTTVTDTTGRTMSYCYNALGKAESVTDTLGRIKRYAYNHRSQNISVIDDENGISVATYDVMGNLTSAPNEGLPITMSKIQYCFFTI